MGTKLNYGKRYQNGGIAYAKIGTPRRPSPGVEKHPPHKPQSRSSILRAAQANSQASMKKDRPTYPDKVVPDKKDIRKYCRQDGRFLELDEFIASAPKRKSYVGISAATSERALLRRQIVEELPFGPILGE